MNSNERTCPGHHTVERPEPALRPDEYLCRGCVRHAERVLGDLVALTSEIETTVTRQDRGARNTGRTVGHALPLPVNVDTSTKARAELELLFEWADHVAAWHHVTGLPPFAKHRPLNVLVPRAVAILLHHADWMRTNEQGPDLASAISYVRNGLRRLVDVKLPRLYAGPCNHDLGYPAALGYTCRGQLFRKWGSDEIVCDGYTPDRTPGVHTFGCGTTRSASERREWLRIEVGARLLPLRTVYDDLHELVPGCDLSWDTVVQWTKPRRQTRPRLDQRGQQRTDRVGRPLVDVTVTPARLEPQGVDLDGTPLYRGSEIIRLAEDREPRRGRRRTRHGKQVA